jgi:hypothetical protein
MSRSKRLARTLTRHQNFAPPAGGVLLHQLELIETLVLSFLFAYGATYPSHLDLPRTQKTSRPEMMTHKIAFAKGGTPDG